MEVNQLMTKVKLIEDSKIKFDYLRAAQHVYLEMKKEPVLEDKKIDAGC